MSTCCVTLLYANKLVGSLLGVCVSSSTWSQKWDLNLQLETRTLLGIDACQDLGLVSFAEEVHQLSPAQDTTKQFISFSQNKELFDNKFGKLPHKYSIVTD